MPVQGEGNSFAPRSGGKNLAKSLAGIIVISFRIKTKNHEAQKQLILHEGSLLTSGMPRNQEHRSARYCPHSALCKPPRYEKQDERKMLDPLQLCAGTA